MNSSEKQRMIKKNRSTDLGIVRDSRAARQLIQSMKLFMRPITAKHSSSLFVPREHLVRFVCAFYEYYIRNRLFRPNLGNGRSKLDRIIHFHVLFKSLKSLTKKGGRY